MEKKNLENRFRFPMGILKVTQFYELDKTFWLLCVHEGFVRSRFNLKKSFFFVNNEKSIQEKYLRTKHSLYNYYIA